MSRMERTLLLIDGEHYPPVIEAALPTLRKRRLEPVGALFLGGFEKTSAPPDLPIPVHSGDPCALLPKLIAALDVDTVMDLSDEPVVNPRERFTLAGIALAAGASYAGGGFRFDPPKRTKLTMSPSVTVAGTGKRTGKTAVAIDLARHWKAAHRRTCIVTMGRGRSTRTGVRWRRRGTRPCPAVPATHGCGTASDLGLRRGRHLRRGGHDRNAPRWRGPCRCGGRCELRGRGSSGDRARSGDRHLRGEWNRRPTGRGRCDRVGGAIDARPRVPRGVSGLVPAHDRFRARRDRRNRGQRRSDPGGPAACGRTSRASWAG